MTIIRSLLEGITHIEDLDLPAFIRAVQNISKMQASEKLDGANLWFGLDDEGRLYTSRAGKRKNAENMYEEKDYPYFAAYNGFRAAHAALQAKEEEIKHVLRPGDTVEIEVLFGRQPNAVTYGAGGKNYIAFLRGVDGTQDILVDQLSNMMSGEMVTVKVQTVDTIDGQNLKLTPTEITYQFVGAQKIDTAHLKTTDVSKQLQALNTFLQAEAGVPGRQMTNFDLATASLGSFDKEIRPTAKEMRNKVLATIMTQFKLPIKKELLDKFVAKIKSPLASSDLTPDEDIGIEGVVLRDPENGEQIKLVDKDTFTTVNQFNHAVRGTLSGVIKTVNPEASMEARGGLLGALKITIADLLGNVELARTQGAKKIFATLKGKNAEETVKNVAKQLVGGDDYLGTKKKIQALIENTQQTLAQALKDFKDHKDEFQLKLKNGKSMGYTAEVIRRTLVSFAEAARDLSELHEKVGGTKNIAQLVALLYGRIAKAVHAVEDEPAEVAESLKEEVLLEKRMTTDKAAYAGKDAWTILNTYFAVYMQAAVITKAGNKEGIRVLRDKTHMRLQSWNKEMSPLNFWGYVVWRAGTPAVRKLIGPKAAAEIFKHARQCPSSLWKFMHMDLSYGKEVPIEWHEHRQALAFLQRTPGMNIDRVNSLLEGVMKYDTLDHDAKVKFHAKLFYYTQQFAPMSPLTHWVRMVYDQLLFTPNEPKDPNDPITEMKLLQQVANSITEDGEAAPASGAGATGAATTSGAIANYAQPLFGERRIIKRVKRNPDIVRVKFPRPKPVKTGDSE
jgi:hypothetical protein